MTRFFSPAILLMNRLGYSRKFALLWALFLVAVAVVVSSLHASLDKEIRNSRRELEGIALARPISRAVQSIQQHRGLSAALLGAKGGGPAMPEMREMQEMREMRAARDTEVGAIFAALEGQLPPNLVASADWRSIKANWTRLREDGLTSTMEASFAAHTRLIEQLLFFRVVVSGEYVLSLDPQIDTAYLIDATLNRLPMALEHLGQIRAQGSAVLARKRIAEYEEVRINTLVAQLDDEIRFLAIDLDRVGGYNPALRDALAVVSAETAALARQIVDRVASEIVAGSFATAPEDFFDLATEAIDRGYAQQYETLLPMIETLIRERIVRAENELRSRIGIALLLALVVAYFGAGIYYATAGGIQSLARSARAFAGGDLRERIDLGTRDELGQVGNSFNEMADGFGAMLEARKRADAALIESGERFHAVIETAMDAMVQMDTAGIITGWNRQAAGMFGWSREEALGRPLHETIIPPRHCEAHVHGMTRFLAADEGTVLNSRIETEGLHRDGREFPVELSITAIRTAGRHEFNGFIRDISRRKADEDLIWKQANFDALTSLPNRRMFHDRLTQEILKAHRAGLTLALLFIDLDRFKEVNDALGHSAGDLLLAEAARRIGDCVRESDTVARLGGDEFIVLLTELGDTHSIERVAEDILRKLVEPFSLGNEVAYVSASIGITLYPDDADDTEGLLKDADQAMYAAKKQGRNRVSYFTAELDAAARTRRHLINDLHGALAAKQFQVYYQPIVELATGRIHKAEALIRWQHPLRGLISPVEFIPLAEETGLIIDIGDWVFREVAQQVRHWRASHDPEFQISVNKSPVQFRGDDSLYKSWFPYLQELELPGQSMVIEITEGLLLNAESAILDKLLQFHNAGIQISLDDFGTGYSSLSYLQKFDLDYLKIDQSFTRNLAPGSSSMALSEAIIVMAHKLGMKVIAEGVETEAQRTLLAEAGCDYAQGYLYSKPVPPEAFEKLLNGAVRSL